MSDMQIRQANIRLTNQRLVDSRQQRLMKAPVMSLYDPYEPTPIPRQPLPAVNAPRTMTYDEAYDEASITTAELVGTNSPDYDETHDRILDELCIKHDIE